MLGLGHQQGEVHPAVDGPSVVYPARHQVLEQGRVHAHAVPKELVAQPEGVPLRVGQKFRGAAQTVDLRMHRIHGPDNLAAGHDVLVHQPFVQVAEGLGGLVDHDQLEGIEAQLLLLQRRLPGGAVYHKFAEVEALHGIVFGQFVFQTGRLCARQFAVSFQQGHLGSVRQDQLAQGIGQGVFQILDRGVDLGLRRYGKLLRQQQDRGLFVTVRRHSPGKQFQIPHPVFLLDFYLNGLQPLGPQLLVHFGAVPLVLRIRRVHNAELHQPVFCPEFVEHLQGFPLQALESGGKVSFQVYCKKQGFVHFFQKSEGAFSQGIAFFGGQVPAEMHPLRPHVRSQNHRCEQKPLAGRGRAVAAAQEHPPGAAQEKGREAQEIHQVPAVQHPAGEREVMLVHSQLEDEQLHALKEGQVGHALQTVEQQEAAQHAAHKGHNGVVCEGRRKKANAEVGRSQKEEPHVGTGHAAQVHVAQGVAQLVHGEHVGQGGEEGQAHQDPARQELAQDNLAVGQGLGLQEFQGAQAAFVGQHAHGQGRDEEEEHPRCQHKEAVELGIAAVEQVKFPGEEPQKQGSEHQKDAQNGVSRDGGEKTGNFF